MDNIQYFKSAWGDIKNSPGWFGKLCLLALLNFIPVFGQIVTFAYLYGWAREIAWGVHKPMPKKLFDNTDGKFWRRGWFILVLTFVFALIPYILISLGDYWQGLGWVNTFFNGKVVDNPLLIGFGTLLNLVGWIGLVLCGILAWVGSMRVAIYDRLSAGFQFGKLWKMMRHDTGGILRIFGMELLFSFILGMLLALVVTVLFSIVIAVGVAGLVNAGYSLDVLPYMTSAQAMRMLVQFIASAGAVGVFAVLVSGFLSAMVALFVDMLVIRAVGYWTMQFDVPRWDGQDDPMPFELDDKPDGEWINEPPQPPYQPSRPSGSQQTQTVPASQVPQAAPQQVVAPVAVPAVADAAAATGQATSAGAETGSGDFGFAETADASDYGELPAVDEAGAWPETGSGADAGAGGAALPGFTYAGVDQAEFPAAPEPAIDPIGQGELDDGASAVEYDAPAIVGAEFLMSPEAIEELTPDDVEEPDSDERG